MAPKDPDRQREYSRKWRAANREKERARGRKYYAENREKVRERHRRYNAENREKVSESSREYQAANRERRAANSMVSGARRNAVKKGVAFDLDGRNDDLHEIISSGVCHYTGLPFNLRGGHTWDSPSLDRVIPELGYVWSNVRVVLNCINMFKGRDPLEKICFVAEHLLDWQAAKAAQTTGSVLLPELQKETDSENPS